MDPISPFHLAIPVHNLDACRRFYGEVLGCREGRSSDQWVDFDLFGHQLVVHCDPTLGPDGQVSAYVNPVDGHGVPVPHTGVVLEMHTWQELAARLRARTDIRWVIEPYTRFAGERGEHSTMFVLDPAGNALEFKAFADDALVFAT